MRSARMFLAAAAASAVLAIAAPGAYADDGGWNPDDSSHSKEHGKDSSHDGPHGGMHTGGGALATVKQDSSDNSRDPRFDPNTYKDHGSGSSSSDGWSGEHDKPHGGMHTGGGALAMPTVTTGGLAVLAVAGTGLYAARRRKTAGSVV